MYIKCIFTSMSKQSLICRQNVTLSRRMLIKILIKVVLYVKIQKNYQVFSQLSAAFTIVQLKMCWIGLPSRFVTAFPLQNRHLYSLVTSHSIFVWLLSQFHVHSHTVDGAPHTQVLVGWSKLNNLIDSSEVRLSCSGKDVYQQS